MIPVAKRTAASLSRLDDKMDAGRALSYFIDVCLIAGILAISYNLLQYRGERNKDIYLSDAEDDGEIIYFENGPSKENLVRTCSLSAGGTFSVILDISFVNMNDTYRPVANDTGDLLLNMLIDNCKCHEKCDFCAQWTLSIDELSYSKTETGHCAQDLSAKCPKPMLYKTTELGDRTKTTIAELILKGNGQGNDPFDNFLECFVNEVLQSAAAQTVGPVIPNFIVSYGIRPDL